MTRKYHDDLRDRAKRYQGAGDDFSHAFNLAACEIRIANWHESWGDYLPAIVFGDFDPPSKPVATEAVAPIEDDYFAGDDAVGTKLDLAKAYMDMGDPEGARSMLDEVIAEGNDAQKAEAHRLLAEVR